MKSESDYTIFEEAKCKTNKNFDLKGDLPDRITNRRITNKEKKVAVFMQTVLAQMNFNPNRQGRPSSGK